MGGNKKRGQPVKIALPQPDTKYAALDADQALLRRCVAPTDPEEIKWLMRHQVDFQIPDGLFRETPWRGEEHAIVLEEESYKGQEQRFAIYKTHRLICEEIESLDQRQSANALFSMIVWFKKSRRAEGDIVKNHIYSIRKILIYLGQQGRLLDIYHPPRLSDWLSDIDLWLADDGAEESTMEWFQVLSRVIQGKLELGQRQKKKVSVIRTGKSKRLNKAVWELGEDGSPELDLDVFTGPPGDGGSGDVSLAPQTEEDDGKPTDVIALGNTSRTGSDARFHARRLHTSLMLGGLNGYDHKETYTPRVAAYFLSHLDPATTEGRFAALTIILGRVNKHWARVEVVADTITVASVQNPDRDVVLTLPSLLKAKGVNRTKGPLVKPSRIYAKVKAQLKKEESALGTRLTMGALARFGVMRFHGKIGIVQSEQLQGSQTKGRVTAIYGALETVDFQRALDKIIVEFSTWLLEEASYVGGNWRGWAKKLKSEIPKNPYVTNNEGYGSTKGWALTNSIAGAVNRQLKNYYECVVDVSARDARRLHCIEYINVCAKALNLAYMAITGARPLTEITRVAIGEDCVAIADKRHYGERAARVLRMPAAWLEAMRRHLSNYQVLVGYLVREGLLPEECDMNELRHPFVVVEIGKKNKYRIEHLTQEAVVKWVGYLAGAEDLSPNGLRHAKVTEMLKKNEPDGAVANVLGHERGLVDGTSPYLSTAALVETPISGTPWVPVIKNIDDK